ncbi:winged helix-turn-helix domain-containing protein [Hydrogenovibrio kuenenii]|uniref:winged helix-turn-helix domain-containing protein n=1 Tax=Hydrogenovibrio kuenenii TaxID=63658 RepID=UPI000462FA6A|nr:winged helix-turn-helix domain-containing protein [Hydrogenovibrio kuenenii]
MPGERYSEKISARFWLTGQSDAYVGIGRITLLEKIQQLGSINAAAKDMQMSYKKAWRLIEEMNQFFDEPLVVKEQGGKAGGGTRLTDKGKKLVKEFRRIESGLTEFLQRESALLRL